MPVRSRAVEKLVELVRGPYTISNRNETIRFAGEDPVPLTEGFDPIEHAYIGMVDSIDWNRVLLEAHSRHVALDHKDPSDDDEFDLHAIYDMKGVCAECINEALIRKDWTAWDEEPKANREVP